ncbi:MAG: hypothetical protein A2X55_03385 [Nitrospirae bacterium GWB2_47_37]|nr:MAG: hypothetical protein A2Z82_03560 [Nitrospirae bacterium GWA2_46_11]OGW23637.1 MAG: hypothetical protein A2X55_03385 [Nitrospirae bacterium GWB2_47_37]
MTLKTKSIITALLVLAIVLLSFELFTEYNALNNSILTNHTASHQILRAEELIYKVLSESKPDIETAQKTIAGIEEAAGHIDIKKLTPEEMSNVINVKMSFIRIERLLKGISGDRTADEPSLRQINSELRKIEKFTEKFIESFKHRREKEVASMVKIQIALLPLVGIGIIALFIEFYRSFLKPITYLTSQVQAVKDRKISNISVYKGKDEIGRLSDFTYRTLGELHKSNEALSERLELQYAMSEILKEAQKPEDIDVFLKKTLDFTLSLKWLKIMDTGAIFLIDEAAPDKLAMRAERNFSDWHKKTCAEVPLGRCICGKAALAGKTIYKPSIDADHENTYDDIIPHGHYCVPIRHEGAVMGVITLYLEENYAPSEVHINFLDNIAIIISDLLSMKKLAESEHLITQAVEESGDGVVIANKRGVIEYANPAFERITGYAEIEFIGKSLMSRIGQEEFKDEILKNINSGNVWSDTILNKKKDGKEYLEHVSIIPVKNAKGEVLKFVSISRDVTREKSLEEQLRQSQKMEVVGRLAGGIAHDFNNLLTTIIGYANLMGNEIKAGDPLKQYVGHILSASERAATLTQSLLAFSRKQIINPTPADINDIIRRLEKLLLRLIGEDVELKATLSEGALTVMADAIQVEQVLMNLATNARDAMPKGGLLTIETKPVIIDSEYAGTHLFAKPGMYACISVTDTGIGMDEKTRKNIFEPFFTTKELGKGTGLGLSIIYGIVKQHDGDINVYSEPGKGSTFKVYFPIIKAAAAERKGGDIALPPPKGGTETVLVAEDNLEVREIVKAVLEGAGYTIIEAVDGEDAVQKFNENKDRVQLLLLDVIMPRKNGKEAYDEIKPMRPGIKTVFMSGYTADIIDRKGMIEAGAELVSKPISPNGLLRKIREVLDR